MSDEKQNNAGPIAIEFVETELTKARKGRNSTRIVMGILTVVVFAYMTILRSMITPFLEPKTIAEMVSGNAIGYVDEYGQQLVQMADEKTPEYIAMGLTALQQQLASRAGIEIAPIDSASGLSEQVLAHIPDLFRSIEYELIESLKTQAEQVSADMEDKFDVILETHADEINGFMEAAQSEGAINEFGEGLRKEILAIVDMPGPDGESIRQKLYVSNSALKRISKHIERLANAKDLTTHEANQRRVITIISKTAEVSGQFE